MDSAKYNILSFENDIVKIEKINPDILTPEIITLKVVDVNKTDEESESSLPKYDPEDEYKPPFGNFRYLSST